MGIKKGNIIKKLKKVNNWKKCAEACQLNPGCEAWKYNPIMKKQKYPKLCTLYSEHNDFTKDKYSIVGSFKCPSETGIP